MTDDWIHFNCGSRQATQGLEFAAGVMADLASNSCRDNGNGTSDATCSDGSGSSRDSHGGAEASTSTSGRADLDGYEQADPSLPSYMFVAIRKCHDFLYSQVSREMDMQQSDPDIFSELAKPHLFVKACRTQWLWAGTNVDPLTGSLLSKYRHQQSTLSKKQIKECAALEGDRSQRRAVRNDQNCWGCGMSADEVVAVGRLSLPPVSGSERAKLLSCNRCKVAKYCCAKCQKSQWKKRHKLECTEVLAGE